MTETTDRGFEIGLARPGDFGWVLARHETAIPAQFGWSAEHAADVALIIADFMKTSDPARERFWIARREDRPVGSIALVGAGDGVAKLRLLFVDEAARGLGVGSALVETCLNGARELGYREMTLWTIDVMTEARKLYARYGFEIADTSPNTDYGPVMTNEIWRRAL